MRVIIAFVILTVSLSFFSPAYAKVLPRFQGKPVKATGGAAVGVFPKLRADRQALLVTFTNLQLANSVSYTLMYQANGNEEGAGGSVDSSAGSTATRELLFGTCSAGVCRYHSGMSNMRLEVTVEYKNGKKATRRFRIKV